MSFSSVTTSSLKCLESFFEAVCDVKTLFTEGCASAGCYRLWNEPGNTTSSALPFWAQVVAPPYLQESRRQRNNEADTALVLCCLTKTAHNDRETLQGTLRPPCAAAYAHGVSEAPQPLSCQTGSLSSSHLAPPLMVTSLEDEGGNAALNTS